MFDYLKEKGWGRGVLESKDGEGLAMSRKLTAGEVCRFVPTPDGQQIQTLCSVSLQQSRHFAHTLI